MVTPILLFFFDFQREFAKLLDCRFELDNNSGVHFKAHGTLVFSWLFLLFAYTWCAFKTWIEIAHGWLHFNAQDSFVVWLFQGIK